MAFGELIVSLLGEAIISEVQRSQYRTVERLRSLWQWLTDVGEPPPGMRLASPDGTTHTGLVIVDRNRVVVLIALRHRGANQPATHGSPLYQEHDPRQQLFDDEWPPGHYPPGRHYSPVR